jgi:3-oxoacyl-(acyl-carrier-protein) synthase
MFYPIPLVLEEITHHWFSQKYKMKPYITAYGNISPQPVHNITSFPEKINEEVTNRLACIEPDYRNILNPLQLRRMPRILKMGLAAAQICISRSENIQPDAIIVGTGLGCLNNLEQFMMEMLNSDENITSVLPFINSTHNAVAAQIAMMLKNHNYNVTYCHRGFSFESALLDALLFFENDRVSNILVGGIDECTDDFVHIYGYLNYWKQPVNNSTLVNSNTPGTIAGEGSVFFMLSDSPKGNLNTLIRDVHTFITADCASIHEIESAIDSFLLTNQLNIHDIDIAILGINGDAFYDANYYSLMQSYFNKNTVFSAYKNLCGEYYTSSAFALWLSTVILSEQKIPDTVKISSGQPAKIKNILIYNHIRNVEHSLILLSSIK